MKRVICIDDEPAPHDDKGIPSIKKGKIYHPVQIHNRKGNNYYELIECGNDAAYLTSMFIEIEEDGIDETELLEQRENQLQTT